MKQFSSTASLVIVLLFLTAIPALADTPINPERPGFTNGPDTVGTKILQLEGGITRSEGNYIFTDGGILRYGVSEQTELRLGLPSWQRGVGFSPVSYGLKTTLRPHLGLIVQTSGEHPSQTQAALEADFAITRDWTLQVDAVRDSRWSSGFNLGRPLTKRLSLFVESYRLGAWYKDGGITYQLTPDQQLDISGNEHFLGIGYAWRLR
ncbi:hypothetical protein [Armatimonas sp.]|uniref:hypothetical protein n=1 Tax=Armatimonas sp. TaxID=1872638 RepID=UPI00286C8FB0|nr:hypothetical protein [Armatimonas sp.]